MPKRKSTKSRKNNQRGFISLPSVLRKKKPARNKSGKFKSKSFKFFGKQIPKLRVYTLAAVLVFAAVGAYLTFFSKAATYPQKGMNPGMNWTSPVADHAKNAEYLKASGAQWARVQVLWNEVEKSPGNYYWGKDGVDGLDSQVAELRKRGIGVILVNDRAPCFASTQPGKVCNAGSPNYGSYNQHWKPDNAMHANFMRALAAHYSAAPFGVHTYEVWNEPNKSAFWPSAGPDSNINQRSLEYAQMLVPSYEAIKAGDPNGTVLFGGMTASDDTFLNLVNGKNIYVNGHYRYGINAYDGLSTHLYPPANQTPEYCPRTQGKPTNRSTLCSLELLQRLIGSRKIWLTELSWSTCSGGDSRCVHPSTQAAYVSRAHSFLTRYSFVKTAMWYQLLDGFDTRPWGNGMGILDANYGAKASWAYYRNVPQGPALNSLENSPYTVPDTTKPTVSINIPKNGATVSGGYVELQSLVSDNNISAGLYVEYKLNGQKFGDRVYARNDGAGYYTTSTWNSTTVGDGTYSLSSVATDAAGNFQESATVTITVYNSAPPPPTGQCNDGIDNDGDGGIDWLGYPGSVIDHQNAGTDPECDSATDSEY